MKTLSTSFLALATAATLCSVGACSDDVTMTNPDANTGADTNTGTDGNMMTGDGGDGGVVVKCPADIDPNSAILENTLTADKTLLGKDSNGKECQYLLKGLFQVKAPATLTIEAGAIIKGDKNSKGILLVQKGGKIKAMGKADAPVVFTSANSMAPVPGDWGGVIILGNAPGNNTPGSVEGIVMGPDTQYGGTDAMDSSGELHYVRIEYPGVVLSANNEVNGLTMAGVGAGTKIDHIQVRAALDDCFEFFGGTVNAKYLACQSNEDDGFDTDNGFVGKLQFLVIQQSPTHDGEDNAFESDNDATGSTNMPFTSPTVYNATLIGKNADLPTAGSWSWLVRRNTRGKYFNIVAMGFDAGLDLRDVSTGTNATNGELDIQSSLFFGMKAADVVENITRSSDSNDGNFDETGWIKTGGKKNSGMTDPGIAAAFNQTAPVFGPTSSLTTNAATPPHDGFFDATATYIGAFKDANDKWATTGTWVKWSDK